MRLTRVATVLAVGLTLGLASQANAAPGAGLVGDLKAAASEASAVEKTYWTTNCWWHHGHRHCRQVWVYPYRFWGGHHYHHRHHWRRHWH